jgi:uncharacterized protein
MIETIKADTWHHLVEKILSVSNPIKIILFGSQARGDAKPDSDYDLLVIVSDATRSCYTESGNLISLLSKIGLSADVVVKRISFYQAIKGATVGFWGAINREGILLYEN